MKGVVSLVLLSSAVAQRWEKCIGDEIAQCASCIFEYGAEVLAHAIEASEEDGNEPTVAGVLHGTGQALKCAEQACAAANTQQFASQCGSMWCKTDFCIMCCGAGSWQCMGNDWKPLCAPSTLSQRFIDNVVKKAKRVATTLLSEATEKFQDVKDVVVGKTQEISESSGATPRDDEARPKAQSELADKSVTPQTPQPVTPAETFAEAMAKAQQVGVQPCECAPGSGNPSTCCSACYGGTTHHRSNCVGHGENTGPYCGNDWHGVACYGENYLCCTNDNDVPTCCKAGQRCHAPLLGANYCVDEEETLMV
jgi:hypothetical protein